jgi:drug/metabolite transporter (DMT)-like permease
MTRPRPTDWLVLAALVVVWGSAFAALKIAVAHIHPLWNTVFRIWIGVATLAVVMALQRQALPPLRDPAWRVYAITGFVGMSAPFALFAYAAERIPSAVNSMCNGASPIFTAVLAHLFLAGGQLTGRKAAGVALGFAGLAVLVAPKLAGGVTLEATGLATAIFGAALYSFANVLIKRSPAVTPTVGALMMCLWAGVFAIPTALALAPPPSWPPMSSLLAVTGLGVFPTALASIGYVYLIQRRGPLFMSMAIYLAPLWATLLGVVFLAERPGWPAFAALGLILAGVGLASLEPKPRVEASA